jgi:cytosine/adenosine deaminase-related metal-dependent hydrolase
MDPDRRVINDGAVLVENELITQVGKSTDIKPKNRVEFEIDAKGKAVLPGLIDTHVHLAQALIRGCADDTSLIDWLRKFVWPLQGNFDSADGKVSAELCMLEMLKSGTTTFLESGLHWRYGFDGIAETLEQSGLRGILSKMVMDMPSYGAHENIMHPGMVEDRETCLREVEEHFQRWNCRANGRIQVWYGVRSLGACTRELYEQVAQGAGRLQTGVTMHLSEVQDDIQYSRKNFDKLPAEFIDEVGLVGPNVVFAHGVWLSEKEWAILARKGSSIAHCPSSNMKLASGIARVPEMTNAGVNVSLGCDGGPSNNCYDLIREMKTASLAQKARLLDPLTMSAQVVMDMATINGAKALGLESELGSIEVGKKADLVLINLTKPHLIPQSKLVSNIVYSAQGEDVDTTIVDGKILMENRVVKTLDEDRVLREASERAERLMERAGLSVDH